MKKETALMTTKSGVITWDNSTTSTDGVYVNFASGNTTCHDNANKKMDISYEILCNPNAVDNIEKALIVTNPKDPCNMIVQFEHEAGCGTTNFAPLIAFIKAAGIICLGLLMIALGAYLAYLLDFDESEKTAFDYLYFGLFAFFLIVLLYLSGSIASLIMKVVLVVMILAIILYVVVIISNKFSVPALHTTGFWLGICIMALVLGVMCVRFVDGLLLGVGIYDHKNVSEDSMVA
jgi:hypothetical protein